MRTATKKIRILWVAPNLNPYKIQFLSRLAENQHLELVVMAGQTPTTEGYRDDFGADRGELPFRILTQAATKQQFAFHPAVFANCTKILWNEKFDIVLMPAEKKHLPLLIWLVFLRLFLSFKLFSYNHPLLRSGYSRITRGDKIWTRIIFSLYDKIIFYTEIAREWAVSEKLISREKTGYANNTLNTDAIWQNYQFRINSDLPVRLLFIGRLVTIKRVDLFLEYFQILKESIPDLCATIIGDGPDMHLVKSAAQADKNIKWCGALVDETEIAKEMDTAHAVFIPGWSGLSIVHAFAYGKPYITHDQVHPPEITYLIDGENGLLLDGDIQENSNRIARLLTDPEKYSVMCERAFATAKNLSIDKWSAQMLKALS